jgi:hypothetical protein
MIQNDGYILFEDPDIEANGPIPPHDSLIFLFPRTDIDPRLYEWTVNVRYNHVVGDSKRVAYLPAKPGSFTLDINANRVRVTPVVAVGTEILIRLDGHILGDHKLLKKEVSGLTSVIVFNREVGDPTDLTTLDWTLYNWRKDTREYVRVPDADYSLVKAVDKVTATLTNPITSWVSTRLLGVFPSGAPTADEKVRVTSNDTTTDYLLPKLRAGAGIAITEYNDGADEQAEITATGAGANDKFSVFVTGPYDATSKTGYTLPEAALHNPPNDVVQLYHNGRRLNPNEYTMIETFVGSGKYKDLTLVFAPNPKSKIYADYVAA